ncbi:hypothetical protein K469DRAFT_549029 [Zopfia rhizophila CBS 207.26]|uniref:Uncharacterized protein n=1 Tax=Zopfia rhizophila CBS 207.26 TaxID=1314779 RepID=A0A6A6ET42_9PEZI|nr:hypothetical protein K469DRAFT_549029 [Zopfia rhizophila CBS 207.26]
MNEDKYSLYFEEECDIRDLSLTLFDKEMAEWTKNLSQHPLSQLDLEFLGLCCDPELLKCVLSPLATKRSLRVIHIRQSGTDLKHYVSWGIQRSSDALNKGVELDTPTTTRSCQIGGSDEYEPLELTKLLHDLAQWVFGPKGLPSLEVIVCGDFFYKGRYAQSNVFLCRNVGLRVREQDMAGQTFRHFSRDDLWQRNLLNKYSNILAACPASPFFQD